MQTPSRLSILFATLAGGVFVFDQWTKAFMGKRLPQIVIPKFLGFIHHENHGFIANLPSPTWFIVAVSSLISLFVLIQAWKAVQQGRADLTVALALVIGGALGNLIDRLRQGYVFDWILVFERSIINVADIAVGVGIILFLWRLSPARTKTTETQNTTSE